MSFPSKAIGIDGKSRGILTKAASVVKHAKISVGSAESELTAGLANRRIIYIKPVKTNSERYIRIGPSGFSTDDVQKGTIVWESYEIALPVTPDVRIYAVKDDLSGDVDVRVLEVGEGT